MRATFLGTGSALPTGNRNQTGILLESAGQELLVDCGSGVLGALARTPGGYESVDTVLLTHHHLDHVADLLPLLKARWLADTGTLSVVGPQGTKSLLADLLDAHEYLQGRVRADVREIAPGTTTTGGFEVRARAVEHTATSLGYRLWPDGSDGPALVFSGDCAADAAFLSIADGAAVLVHDCSFPDGTESSTHPTPTSLATALNEAGSDVERIYLTHLYPQTDGRHDEMVDAITARYDGDVAVARDGLTVEV